MPPCLGNKASKVVAVDVDYDYYYDPIYRSSARLRIRSLQRFRDNQRLSYLRAESLPFQPLTMALLPLLPSSAGGSTVADKLLPSLGKFSPPPPAPILLCTAYYPEVFSGAGAILPTLSAHNWGGG